MYPCVDERLIMSDVMFKCLDCEFSNGKTRGYACPASRITPQNFSAGCTLGKASTIVRKPEPIKAPSPKAVKPATVKQAPVMTATEREYAHRYLAGKDYRYEGHPLKMANGHTYTGDWAVFQDGQIIEIHECKGGWSFASQQRSRLAFDQCRIEFPKIKFVWAKKSKKKGWIVK